MGGRGERKRRQFVFHMLNPRALNPISRNFSTSGCYPSSRCEVGRDEGGWDEKLRRYEYGRMIPTEEIGEMLSEVR